MNEGLEIFINDEGTNEEDKALVKKIDELLWNFGITYTGVNNIYRPLEAKNRDNTLYAACRALQEADWLKDRLAYISIMNWVDTCPIERIQVVPGDILKVETKNGQGFICVRDIAYITGKSFCKEHRNVIKHMKKRLPPVG